MPPPRPSPLLLFVPPSFCLSSPLAFISFLFPSRPSLESGSDYTLLVKDQSSDAEHESPAFTILGTPDTNVEVTSPDG